MKIGFLLHGAGHGRGDWRHPDAPVKASVNLDFYRRQALAAEAAKLHFLFVSDGLSVTPRSAPHFLSRFEPLTILSYLAGVTTHIGLVATVSSSFSEPYNVARQFGSLDQISGGRSGWNVVTSWLRDAAANFGQDHLAHDDRYRLAAEHLDVVQGLWDSWEAGAILNDKESGVFFDPAKLHPLNHSGEFFQVKGPLNVERSPQGQPVVFQAGVSAAGRAFAAARADAVFIHHATPEQAAAHYADVKARAQRLGRQPGHIKILHTAQPLIGATEAEAGAKFREFVALTSDDDLRAMMGRIFGDHDFGAFDLDAPFPLAAIEATGAQLHLANALEVLEEARALNLTLRDAALRHAVPRGHFVGTPQAVADAMEAWFQARACDGFNVLESLPGQLEVFTQTVIPILRDRGLFHRDYDGATLRGHLGVPEPENRYTRARRLSGQGPGAMDPAAALEMQSVHA
jgi:FMN-dependent oxidoreductase (nitrilotriacetate monooxygenase family)